MAGEMLPTNPQVHAAAAYAWSAIELDPVSSALGGYLSPEALLVLMCETLDAQNVALAQRVQELRQQNHLQKDYAQFREIAQAARAAAKGAKLSREEAAASETLAMLDLDRLFGDSDQISPADLAAYLNEELFGTSVDHYVGGVTGDFKDADDFQQNVLNPIEDTAQANVQDTTLLTAEIQAIMQQTERLTNLFTKLLQGMHETAMAVIRNL